MSKNPAFPWPPGDGIPSVPMPWRKEPSAATFRAAGLRCVVIRNRITGCLNGYVALPHAHPLHGIPWLSPRRKPYPTTRRFGFLRVHGGVSVTGSNFHPIRFFERRYWVGFDTAHLCDLAPFMVEGLVKNHEAFADPVWQFLIQGRTYRTWDYVVDQTCALALQLSKVTR